MDWKYLNKSQSIWNKWLPILESRLQEMGFEFRNLPEKDFWIDWQIELLEETWDLWTYKVAQKVEVQVKTTEKVKLNKNWKYKISVVTRDDLQYWHHDTNMPVIIVWVDLGKKRAYWIDTTELYRLSQADQKRKDFIIYWEDKKEICVENKAAFKEFINEFLIFTHKRNLAQASHSERLSQIWEKMWYWIVTNLPENQLQSLNPLLVFNDGNKSIWLVSTDKSLEYPIKWKFNIKKLVSGTELSIENLSLTIWWEDIITSLSWTASINPIPEEIFVRLKAGAIEKIIKCTRLVYLDRAVIESADMSFKITFENNKLKIYYSINFNQSVSIEELLSKIAFIEEAKRKCTLYIADNEIISWIFNFSYVDEGSYFKDYCNLLRKIETKFNITFSVDASLNGFIKFIEDKLFRCYIQALADWMTYLSNFQLSWELTEIISPITTSWKQAIMVTYDQIAILWVCIPAKIEVKWEWIIKRDWNKFKVTWDTLFIESGKI